MNSHSLKRRGRINMTSKRMCPMNQHYDCGKEKCAWYLVHSKQCGVPLLASTFKKFIEVLEKGIPK